MSDTKTANAEALAAVNADPVAMAERLAVLPWLADRLAEWPDPWESNTPPTVDGPDGPRVHPAWLAGGAGDHLAQVRIADRMGVRNPEGLRRNAARWAVDKLADLPEAKDSTSGLSLLAAAVERLPKPVKRHRASDVRYPSALVQTREGFGTGDTLPPLIGTRTPGGIQYSILPGPGGDPRNAGGYRDGGRGGRAQRLPPSWPGWPTQRRSPSGAQPRKRNRIPRRPGRSRTYTDGQWRGCDMAKPKRTLADALQAAAKPKPATKTIPSRRGKRAWVIYLDRDAARRLKAAAAMSDRSMQSLGVEAAELLIERYGTR